MTPGVYNFRPVVSGDTVNALTIEVKDNLVAIDLTGCAIKMDFKRKPGYDYDKRLSTENSGIALTNPTGGLFTINSFIANLPPAKYLYDIQFTFSDGTVKTYISGTFEVLSEVTK